MSRNHRGTTTPDSGSIGGNAVAFGLLAAVPFGHALCLSISWSSYSSERGENRAREVLAGPTPPDPIYDLAGPRVYSYLAPFALAAWRRHKNVFEEDVLIAGRK
jgi:hypothetical protein